MSTCGSVIIINCLSGETINVKFVSQYRKGRMCFSHDMKKFYVVDNNQDVELDMDITELMLNIKPWKL